MSEASKQTVCRCDKEGSCQLPAGPGRKDAIATKLASCKLPSGLGWGDTQGHISLKAQICVASEQLVTVFKVTYSIKIAQLSFNRKNERNECSAKESFWLDYI